MNTRANIMFFIEHFLDLSSKERGDNYVRMMQRDMLRIVDAVCPEDGSGAANVKVVRKVWCLTLKLELRPACRLIRSTQVINGLTEKAILPEQTAADIEGCLKERDTSAADVGFSSPANGGDVAPSTDNTSQVNGRARNGMATAAGSRLDKRQIEQRIEEDRERHKRMRESMWTVPSGAEEQGENLFDNTSEIGDDDRVLGDEDLESLIGESHSIECSHDSPGQTNGTRSS